MYFYIVIIMTTYMVRYLNSFIFIAVLSAILYSCGHVRDDNEYSYQLGMIIEKLREESPRVSGNIIYNPDLLIELYEKDEDLVPAKWKSWNDIDQMLYSIRNAHHHGLQPEDYHLFVIHDLVDSVILAEDINYADSARLELLLTDSFLLLSAHLSAGKTRSDTLSPRWNASGIKPAEDWKDFLDNTLAESRIVENLEQLAPGHRRYIDLKEALEKYRQIEEEGGWQVIKYDLLNLEKGMRHPEIIGLRERLSLTQKYIEYDTADITLFDDNLHENVIQFQKRKGLEADGVVDSVTIEAMNVSVYEKISLIKASLDRWRRLHEPGDHYIMVNIPDFELTVVKDGISKLTSRVIVGQPERQTPVFSSIITEVILNPYWIVPPHMLKEDIIPAIVNDVFYLEDRNMEILDADWEVVDPLSVDWNEIDSLLREYRDLSEEYPEEGPDDDFEDIFPYTVRQKPGPDNEMGRVKFILPNPYYVVIHDTPHTHLFENNVRAFSSGCIRINRPFTLLEYLLDDLPEWTITEVNKVMEEEENQSIYLEKPLPVHILYLTAWAGEDGLMHFRDDIYNRDQRLMEALKQHPAQSNR